MPYEQRSFCALPVTSYAGFRTFMPSVIEDSLFSI
jgi:hypothetical protein